MLVLPAHSCGLFRKDSEATARLWGKWQDPKRLGDGPQEKEVVSVLAVSD